MTTTETKRIIRIGTVPTHAGPRAPARMSIYCCINIKDGRLSITGVSGPRANGDAWGGCGQIHGEIKSALDRGELEFAPGWTADLLSYFLLMWDLWHLNDMRAGTRAQEDWLREHKSEYPGYPKSHYDWACESLAKAGLQPDPETGYRYGTQWLTEELPESVIEFLESLPETDQQPAWC